MTIKMSSASVPLTHEIEVIDELGRKKLIHIPAERPLTIYLDKRELITLMTIGANPEALVLGYLRNQRLVTSPDLIESIQVDWETESVAVKTKRKDPDLMSKIGRKIITTGCGQGTVFSSVLDEIETIQLPTEARVQQSAIHQVIEEIRSSPSIYKKSGSVHCCAIFRNLGSSVKLLYHVEDVGRHNAVDAIAGLMWLDDLTGSDLIFYTTGRLTSEMVIKGAQMGIPFLLSRSGTTRMALDVAAKVDMTLLGRCSGQHYLIYSSPYRVEQLESERSDLAHQSK
jgi:FdhD protein